jgi:site-specific recombinase XerC
LKTFHSHLQQSVRLAAIRRIAYEAADTGLLSPELVAGIRRVKGIKRLGQPVGNWLTAQQRRLLLSSEGETLRGKRDRAMLALLLGCGLRRSELVTLKSDQIQQREDHWVIVDLVGKGRHIRTVPIPWWVKADLDTWVSAAGIHEGKLFRSI